MDTFDTQLQAALRRPAPPLADDGVSERVLAALPRRRSFRARSARLTLFGAAAAGGLLASVFGAPLESVVRALVPGSEGGALLVAVLLAALLALPAVVAFYSERR